MKKRIILVLGILFIILIGSLWIIEKKDKHSLQLVSAETMAVKEVYEQVNMVYDILLTYKGENIPGEVKELSIISLETIGDLYGTTMGALDLIQENFRVRWTFDSIRSIRGILSKDTLTSKDYKSMEAYVSQIHDVVKMTAQTLHKFEAKINNYWWK